MKKKILLPTLLMMISYCFTLKAQWSDLGTGISSTTPLSIWSLSVVDENTIWASTTTTIGFYPTFEYTRTTDGGLSWESGLMNGIDSVYYIIQIFALDSVTAWVAVADEQNPISGKIYKTTDGGNNWVEQVTSFTGFNETPAAVYFWDENEGVAFGSTGYMDYDDQISIYTTTDGGENWNKVIAPNMPDQLPGEGMWVYSGNGFYDVFGDHVWFITNGSRIFHSADRGLSWEAQETNIANPYGLASVAFKDEMNGLAITFDPDEIVRTNDSGTTWEPLTPPTGGPAIVDLEYIPSTEGTYIIHDGYWDNDTLMYITFDAGDTWEILETGESMWTIQFLSPQVGFGGGPFINPTDDGIYKWDSDIFVGVEDINSTIDSYNVFPNPFSSVVFIQGENNSPIVDSYAIYDNTGRMIKSGAINSNYSEIQLSTLTPGFYNLELNADGHKTVRKIVKTN